MCTLEDGGTAFVDALEDRQTPFGSIKFETFVALDSKNLKRLLKLDVLNRLELPYVTDPEVSLLPFSARVETLEYNIFSHYFLDVDWQIINIATNKLTLNIDQNDPDDPFPTELATSLWRRVGELGHFVELTIAFMLNRDVDDTPVTLPACVINELIRAVMANRNLQLLDICTYKRDFDWGPHIQTLFNGLKDHKALRKLRIEVYEEDKDK
jgi:hypothetical protein